MSFKGPLIDLLKMSNLHSEMRSRIKGQTRFICTQKMKTKEREAKGSFGRYLATIFLDGENINEWVLAEGLADLRED